jgi:nucleotide-binding universal stress UspA family protein
MSFRRILIALDDSAIAAHAAEVGLELAAALKAQAALVYVVDPALAFQPDGGVPAADLIAALKEEGQAFLAATATRGGEPPALPFLREGKPADQILAAAREWEADAIVIGTHGRSGVSRLMLGSTAESVVRHAPCPVLVVKPTSTRE